MLVLARWFTIVNTSIMKYNLISTNNSLKSNKKGMPEIDILMIYRVYRTQSKLHIDESSLFVTFLNIYQFIKFNSWHTYLNTSKALTHICCTCTTYLAHLNNLPYIQYLQRRVLEVSTCRVAT